MLDFSVQNKPFMTVKLQDERQVFVVPPKKRQLDALVNAQENATIDTLYEMAAELLSNNKQGWMFSMEDLSDWDTNDIQAFFRAYMEFIQQMRSNPN